MSSCDFLETRGFHIVGRELQGATDHKGNALPPVKVSCETMEHLFHEEVGVDEKRGMVWRFYVDRDYYKEHTNRMQAFIRAIQHRLVAQGHKWETVHTPHGVAFNYWKR